MPMVQCQKRKRAHGSRPYKHYALLFKKNLVSSKLNAYSCMYVADPGPTQRTQRELREAYAYA